MTAPVTIEPAPAPVDAARLVETAARWLRTRRHASTAPCRVCGRDALDLAAALWPVLTQPVSRSTERLMAELAQARADAAALTKKLDRAEMLCGRAGALCVKETR